MEAFALATALIALAEIGDKSQLIALALAVRFRRRVVVAGGIAVAALASHAFAGILGVWIAAQTSDAVLRILVAVTFFGMAVWMLVPDSADDGAAMDRPRFAGSAFATTAVLFFVAELGDKTQLATVGLAARFDATPLAVILGSALGMTLVNVPVVWVGHHYAARLPLRALHVASAVVFALLGVVTLWLG